MKTITKLEEIKEGNFLLYFTADWCNPCKILRPIIEDVSIQCNDIEILKIDMDASKNIAEKYNVRSIPTLMTIQDGIELQRKSGVSNKHTILNMIAEVTF
jgi:thioredoxin 1